jgi:hypothetical protein
VTSGELDGRQRGRGSPTSASDGDRARQRASVCEMRQGRERASAGGVQKGARVHGQATWTVSMANARTWVSGGCGKDETDRAGSPGSESERARGRTVRGADEAGLQRREGVGARTRGKRHRHIGPTGQREGERGRESACAYTGRR